MRSALVVPLVAVAALLAGCGDDSAGSTATDPAAPSSTQASSASPTAKPVSVRATCADLYRPPGQWMQHAITFVHEGDSGGSPTGEEIVAGLQAAEDQALEPLAVDIEVVRAGVEAAGSGSDVDTSAFDKAANRLAGHCNLYGD